MTLAIVHTRARMGIEAPPVTVEVHLSNGLPSLNIVGLPETAVRESKDRVRSALLNSHFEFPPRRITINLAPADLPKEGSRFDLAIAMGILAASGQLPPERLPEYEFVGELALSGHLRGVNGVLPSALSAGAAGRAIILPMENRTESALARQTRVLPADHLLAVCAHLRGAESLPEYEQEAAPPATGFPDMSDVIGQQHAKRALEIAAAGRHNLLLSGPPGTGKTMLACRLPGILPALTETEALEVAAIHSVAGKGMREPFHRPPFRAPHHTASAAALAGGGGTPRPGEASLAHRGVLFLDELPEFPRRVLDVLREPMESGEILISRVREQAVYPARFMLVAAMNPCPCGYFGAVRCRCTPDQVRHYRQRISGPLLDRVDLQVEVPAIPRELLTTTGHSGEDSATVGARVRAARDIQLERQGLPNAELDHHSLQRFSKPDPRQRQLLDQAIESLGLSARAYHRILRVARTIADLEASTEVLTTHYTEALGFRLK